MTTEPIRVEPVEVEYYQDADSAVARIVWYVTLIAILYGAFSVLTVGIHLVGIALGVGWWGRVGWWQLVMMLSNGVLAAVLLVSGIGCMTRRPAARVGMFVYGYLTIAVQTFAMGVYVVTTVRNPGAMGLTSSILDIMMMVASNVSWMVQGSLFPLITILTFRMKEVERLFVR